MTFSEARDAIMQVFYSVWSTTGYPVFWTDLPGDKPTTQIPWARVTLKHNLGGQASLSGETGCRMFNRSGTLFIQVFVPVGGANAKGYNLAQKVANAFEDAKIDVWFRNTRMREEGVSGAFEQTNVLTDFQYDEVR